MRLPISTLRHLLLHLSLGLRSVPPRLHSDRIFRLLHIPLVDPYSFAPKHRLGLSTFLTGLSGFRLFLTLKLAPASWSLLISSVVTLFYLRLTAAHWYPSRRFVLSSLRPITSRACSCTSIYIPRFRQLHSFIWPITHIASDHSEFDVLIKVFNSPPSLEWLQCMCTILTLTGPHSWRYSNNCTSLDGNSNEVETSC